MNYCIRCKHVQLLSPGEGDRKAAFCNHPEALDRVYGEPMLCVDVRNSRECGRMGELYEPSAKVLSGAFDKRTVSKSLPNSVA